VTSHCLPPNLPVMWTAHSASHATRVTCQNHCEVGSSNRASPLAAEPAIASRVIEIVSRLSTGRRHMGHLWLDVCISSAQSWEGGGGLWGGERGGGRRG